MRFKPGDTVTLRENYRDNSWLIENNIIFGRKYKVINQVKDEGVYIEGSNFVAGSHCYDLVQKKESPTYAQCLAKLK